MRRRVDRTLLPLASRRRRRGASTAALGTAICAAIFIIVMAVNIAQLVFHRKQAHVGTDAASLSGSPELMDQRPLYDGPFLPLAAADAGLTEPDFLAAIKTQQDQAARDVAVAFAAVNLLDNTPIVLDRNDPNAPDGDIVIGWLDEPADRTAPLADESSDTTFSAAEGGGALNTIQIREIRNETQGNALSLWMAEQVGFDDIDLTIFSRATVDQRIYGLRPMVQTSDPTQPRINVPLLPLVGIPNMGDETAGAEVGHLWWAQGPLDDFAVDCRTATVDGTDTDFIAEIVIRVWIDGSAGPDPMAEPESRRGGLAMFGSETLSAATLNRLAQEGYNRDDLDTSGGEIQLTDLGFSAPAEFTLSAAEITDLQASLNSIIGQTRIIPLSIDPMGGTDALVYGFVAGSVVLTELAPDGSLLVHIQPCVMQTPTAILVGESSGGLTTVPPRNPWIGKVVLSR